MCSGMYNTTHFILDGDNAQIILWSLSLNFIPKPSFSTSWFCYFLSLQFIIEDMKQQQTHKHSKLHREDQHITVEELWRGWKSSEGGFLCERAKAFVCTLCNLFLSPLQYIIGLKRRCYAGWRSLSSCRSMRRISKNSRLTETHSRGERSREKKTLLLRGLHRHSTWADMCS